jgi:hypothetical protein
MLDISMGDGEVLHTDQPPSANSTVSYGGGNSHNFQINYASSKLIGLSGGGYLAMDIPIKDQVKGKKTVRGYSGSIKN